MIHNPPSECRLMSDPGATICLLACRREKAMSTAANDESLDRVDDLLDGRLAALRSEAGLARVLEERGLA